MKKIKIVMKGLIMSLLAIGVLTFSGCKEDEFVPTKTLYDLVSADAELSEMLGYIDADATLKGYAQGTAAYTAFIPNNAAFDKLRETLGITDLSVVNPAIISSVINFHFAAGATSAAELTGASVATVQGESVVGNADGTILTGCSDTKVEILETKELATNGMLHVVGTILIPPTICGTIGVNLGTVAQPILLGAVFTDVVGIIAVADIDVPAGELSITEILADKSGTAYTVFMPVNDVFAGAAALYGITKEEFIGSLTTSAAAARGFMLNHISNAGGVKGSELVDGKTITMMTGNTYIVATSTPSPENPLGIVLVNVLDQAKIAPVYQTDLIDAGGSGAGSNGSAHVSSILQ